MPFHLATPKRPPGPNVHPVTLDSDGRKRMVINLKLDKRIPLDKVECKLDGHALYISCPEPIKGPDGKDRMFKQCFQIPNNIWAEKVDSSGVSEDGKLRVVLLLMVDPPKPNYKCTIKTEQVW